MLTGGPCNPYARRLARCRRWLNPARSAREHESQYETRGSKESELRKSRSSRHDRTTESGAHESLGGDGERHEGGEGLQERGRAFKREDSHEGNDLEHEDDD